MLDLILDFKKLQKTLLGQLGITYQIVLLCQCYVILCVIIWQLYRSMSLFLKKKGDVLIFRGEDSRYLQLIFKWVNRKNEYNIYVHVCIQCAYI